MNDYFGWSVSVSGDSAVVGSPRDDDDGGNSGSVYVFTRSGGAWSQQAKLTADDAVTDNHFGRSVSVAGDTIAIGANGDPNIGRWSGSAYVFTRSGGNWSQQTKFSGDEVPTNDEFGYSVSVSGDTVVIGASREGGEGLGVGFAYVYTRSGGVWSQRIKLKAADGAEADRFGYTVATDGRQVLVGAPQKDDPETDSGAAYVFELEHTVIFETDGTLGATLSGDTSQLIFHGADCTSLTASAPATHVFRHWEVASVNVGTTNPLTVTNVTVSTTYTAVFSIDQQYTLTYFAGTNGSISGVTPQTVDHGLSGLPVEAVPDEGFHFVRWSDGVLTTTRTDTNVTADLTVTAIFAPGGPTAARSWFVYK